MEESAQNGKEKNGLKAETLKYLIVQVLLVVVICLPTVFFIIIKPTHESHEDGLKLFRMLNKTLHQQNRTVAALQCKSPLIFDERDWACRPPCNWTSLSQTHAKIYRSVMVLSLWVTLIAAIITLITWASISNMRSFPHVVRFYMMISCIGLASANMLPLRVGLNKVFCSDNKFWHLEGHSSTTILIQGGFSHYLTLAICFWSTCFVANTYSVIVLQKQSVFEHSKALHAAQFLFCWLGPAIIVLCCIFFDSPAYVFQMIDFLTAQTNHAHMAYYSLTLPMQITLGMSLVLLCSIIRFLRKVRRNAKGKVIRHESESETLMRVERQFISMTVAVALTVGLLLSCKTVMEHRTKKFIHHVDQYFVCLLHRNTTCTVPYIGLASSVLAGVIVMAPGFVCMFFFALLFMNNESRQVWRSHIRKCFRLFTFLCKRRKPETDGLRSRCSSTITVLNERKSSDSFTHANVASFIATDSKPTKTEEPRSDRLVTLTMDQLRSSPSNFTSDEDPRDEEDCDETTALRDVDISTITASKHGTSASCPNSELQMAVGNRDLKTNSSYMPGKNTNSGENLTQL